MSSHTTKPPALLNDGFSFVGDLYRVVTPDGVETLSHLLKRGIEENTLRATRSYLAYLEAWSLAGEGEPLEWPPTKETVMRFIAH